MTDERTYDCADCEERRATTLLPEGRYLCRPCWKRLKALRLAVLARPRVPPKISTSGY